MIRKLAILLLLFPFFVIHGHASPHEEYTLIRQIGKGTYSKVFLSKNFHGELVAVKRYFLDDKSLVEFFEKNGIDAGAYMQQLAKNEIEIGQLIDHPNIVKVKDGWFEGSSGYVVMEYIQGEPFQISKNYSLEVRVSLIRQLLDAIEHLLKRNIIVDDLWSENLLLSSNDHLTLIDLGGNEILNDKGSMPVGHYVKMIEEYIQMMSGDSIKIVEVCHPLLSRNLRKEIISSTHVPALLQWIAVLKNELSNQVTSNNN